MVIRAPHPDGAVGAARVTIGLSSGYLDDVVETRDQLWFPAVRRRAIAELPRRIVAPAPHEAVAIERQDVPRPRRDGDDVRQTDAFRTRAPVQRIRSRTVARRAAQRPGRR